MCFNSFTSNLPPLFYDGVQLPYTFKFLGMVCDRHINLNTAADAALHPFTAGTFRVKQFIREHNLTNRLRIYMWLLKTYTVPAGMYASQLWANHSYDRGKNGQSFTEMAGDSAQENSDGQGRNPFMVRHARVWSRASTVQLGPGCSVAIWLYSALTQSNSSTARTILQADMQLSSRCNDCWSSHILSVINGPTQSYLFKERLLKYEPIDLGCSIVDLRGRIIGHLILICIQESATANAPLTINGAPSLPRGPRSHIHHTPFLDTCSSIFHVTLFAAWLASDFVPKP